MAMTIPPVPRNSLVLKRLGEKLTNLIEFHWDNWFQGIANALNLTSQKITGVALTQQAATVSAAPFTSTTLSAGLYRITYYARITRAASSTSSLTVQFNWTDGGQACSVTESAITANTVTTTQSAVVPIQIDAATSPTYTLTYASTGATTMQFGFTALLELLP